MEYLRVRNWDRYQIWHDGRPMKFFAIQAVSDRERVGILDDPAFLELADDPGCPVFRMMALAARTGNKIPNSADWLQRVLFCQKPVNLQKMLDAKFLEPWSESPANGARTKPYESVPRREEKREEKPSSESVNLVYAHWRTARNRTRANYDTLSDNRRKKIQARLREFSAAELIRAIDAVALDPWEDRPRHDDLTILFRNREQVDKFLALADEAEAKESKKAAVAPCPECGVGGGLHTAECRRAA